TNDYARPHPGGGVGRPQLTRVPAGLRQDGDLPILCLGTPAPRGPTEMSAKGMGMTIVVDADNHPIGIFTDGDLRRIIAKEGNVRHLAVEAGMTRSPKHVAADDLAVKAAALMDNLRINQLLVLDDTGVVIGALHMHDLLAA